MSGKFKGFDKLNKEVEKLSQSTVGLTDLFNPTFMARYTDFKSFEEFQDESPYKFTAKDSNVQDFRNEELDKFVAEKTSFSNWRLMFDKAANEHLQKQFKGIFK
ncbi:hypothetical protein F0342_06880 [Bacillus sp. CH30_1T]|uniref:hypothetical protein n=1 Tax=Bacillus sp. CH30_1T TaxID=2604836 RepID=UPI0011ED5BA3|nr:hypothetical protein [Bacillus sp. CH30_1T]KAA0565326.1 hypothetical protein F0342_06880 [Bacillus sp. CH30_1T]